MTVVFGGKKLELIESGEAIDLRLPLSVINAARKKLTIIRAAPDERTLRNWKSLHYEKLDGDRQGQQSIRINDQWRMVFSINTNTVPPTITILGIEDYH